MKIETKSFNEIPVEIQEMANKEFREGTEILEVTVFDYLNGNKEYIVKAINDSSLIEFVIHSKRGMTSYNSISLPTVLLAIEKVKNKFNFRA
jgi:hypothetical protein